MASFVKSVVILAPVEVVFAFHEREDALRLLSPRFPPLRIIEKQGGIEVGARVVIKIGPMRWVALHTGYGKDHFFEDRQVSGPFAKWIHRHEFEAVDQFTRLTDRVEFMLPGGALVTALFGWIVKLGLTQMFRQRHRTTCKYCERG